MAREVEEIVLKLTVDDSELNEFNKDLKTTEKQTDKVNSALAEMGKLIGAGALVNGLKNLGEQAIDMANQFERINNVLLTTFETQAEVAQQMSFITEISDRLGLSILGASEGYAKLASSAKVAGIATEDTQAIFEGVATAAGALALSGEDVNGILRAFSQSAAKGKVQAEELMQVAERGVPIQAMLADALGVSNDELQEMAQKGELMATDVLPAIARELKETYHEGALKNANGEIARATRRQNEFNESLRLGGEELRTLTSEVGDVAVSAWNSLQDALSDSILGYAMLFDQVDALAGAKKELTQQNKEEAESLKEIVNITEELTESYKVAFDAFDKAGMIYDQTLQADRIRETLGLTEEGFKKISGAVKEAVKNGAEFEDVLFRSKELMEVMEGAFGPDDFIKSEDVKRAEKISELIGNSFTQSLIDAGLDPSTFGQTGDMRAMQQREESQFSTGSQRALESGTREAAEFLSRPIKDQEDVAVDQLETQKKIEKNTAKTANQTPVFLKGMSL